MLPSTALPLRRRSTSTPSCSPPSGRSTLTTPPSASVPYASPVPPSPVRSARATPSARPTFATSAAFATPTLCVAWTGSPTRRPTPMPAVLPPAPPPTSPMSLLPPSSRPSAGAVRARRRAVPMTPAALFSVAATTTNTCAAPLPIYPLFLYRSPSLPDPPCPGSPFTARTVLAISRLFLSPLFLYPLFLTRSLSVLHPLFLPGSSLPGPLYPGPSISCSPCPALSSPAPALYPSSFAPPIPSCPSLPLFPPISLTQHTQPPPSPLSSARPPWTGAG